MTNVSRELNLLSQTLFEIIIINNYCAIWVLDYAKHVGPLYLQARCTYASGSKHFPMPTSSFLSINNTPISLYSIIHLDERFVLYYLSSSVSQTSNFCGGAAAGKNRKFHWVRGSLNTKIMTKTEGIATLSKRPEGPFSWAQQTCAHLRISLYPAFDPCLGIKRKSWKYFRKVLV